MSRLCLDGAYRYVRFDFAARKAGDVFDLCEVEIWSEGVKPKELSSCRR